MKAELESVGLVELLKDFAKRNAMMTFFLSKLLAAVYRTDWRQGFKIGLEVEGSRLGTVQLRGEGKFRRNEKMVNTCFAGKIDRDYLLFGVEGGRVWGMEDKGG